MASAVGWGSPLALHGGAGSRGGENFCADDDAPTHHQNQPRTRRGSSTSTLGWGGVPPRPPSGNYISAPGIGRALNLAASPDIGEVPALPAASATHSAGTTTGAASSYDSSIFRQQSISEALALLALQQHQQQQQQQLLAAAAEPQAQQQPTATTRPTSSSLAVSGSATAAGAAEPQQQNFFSQDDLEAPCWQQLMMLGAPGGAGDAPNPCDVIDCMSYLDEEMFPDMQQGLQQRGSFFHMVDHSAPISLVGRVNPRGSCPHFARTPLGEGAGQAAPSAEAPATYGAVRASGTACSRLPMLLGSSSLDLACPGWSEPLPKAVGGARTRHQAERLDLAVVVGEASMLAYDGNGSDDYTPTDGNALHPAHHARECHRLWAELSSPAMTNADAVGRFGSADAEDPAAAAGADAEADEQHSGCSGSTQSCGDIGGDVSLYASAAAFHASAAGGARKQRRPSKTLSAMQAPMRAPKERRPSTASAVAAAAAAAGDDALLQAAAGAATAGKKRKYMKLGLADMLRLRVLRPGHQQLLIGNSTLVDVEILDDGNIAYDGLVFESISRLALQVLRRKNPGRRACDGWQEVKLGGKRLDALRQEAVRKDAGAVAVQL